MAYLFQPLTIKSVTLKNRIVVSPMCQYSSVDGFANDWHLVHLGGRATGGAALVFSEACAVSPEGRITPDDLGIWKDAHIDYLSRITGFIRQQGAVPGIQLAHAGRKASHHAPWKGGHALAADEGRWQTLAPTALAFKEGESQPKEMDETDLLQLKNDFRQAAGRALAAGFEVLEIHAAHGYLLHEFLSPLSNLRNDRYGGPYENRTRLLLEVVTSVQETWPEHLPLFVRISASDWVEGGWTVEDSIALGRILKKSGVDLVDCSSGGNVANARIATGPLYQVPFAARVKKEAEIRTGAVGLITTAREAESVLQKGQADLVFMARQLLRDPCFPQHAARELGVDLVWPVQYERAKI